jgi:hypothetical protein
MILQPHSGKKEVPDVHFAVKGDGDAAVAYNCLFGHLSTPESNLLINDIVAHRIKGLQGFMSP